MVARAKAEGIPVTCEVTPHHLFLNEDDIKADEYNTNLKMNPPLRTKEDNLALQQALVDGTIDMVAPTTRRMPATRRTSSSTSRPSASRGSRRRSGFCSPSSCCPAR